MSVYGSVVVKIMRDNVKQPRDEVLDPSCVGGISETMGWQSCEQLRSSRPSWLQLAHSPSL